MAMFTTHSEPQRAQVPVDLSLPAFFAVMAAVFAAGFLYNDADGWLNADTSWLIIVAGKVLDGERLYRDVWEANPPFSVLMYLPMAAMERLTGVRAELWTSAILLALAAGALTLIDMFLKRASIWTVRQRRIFLIGLAIIFLFILPGQFVQREHFGAIGAIPLVVLYGLRAQAGPNFKPGVPLAVLAGVLGAMLIMVKPNYGLAFALPALSVVATRRDWKALFLPETIAAGGVFAVYALAVVFVYPAYFSNVLPVVADVYLNARVPLATIMEAIALLALPAFVLVVLLKPRYATQHVLVTTMSLAAFGCLIGVGFSGKGWANHFYPVLITLFAVLLVIAVDALARPGSGMKKVLPAVAAFIALGHVSLTIYSKGRAGEADIPAAVEALGPQSRIAVISRKIQTGNPIARRLNAQWVSRDCSDFIPVLSMALSANATGERKARLEALVIDGAERKMATLIADPVDVIVIDERETDWIELLDKDSRLADVLSAYTRFESGDYLSYYVRSDHNVPTSSMVGR